MKAQTLITFNPFEKGNKLTPDGMVVIHGNVPSKSNCYNIITFKPKKQDGKTLYSVEQRDRIMKLFHDGDWDVLRDELNRNDDGTKKSRSSLAKTKELTNYEKSFESQCSEYAHRMIEGPFKLTIAVYYPSRRSDLDNSLKIVLDCLQMIKAFKNDNNCEEIHAKRKLDKDYPRIEFRLDKIEA